MTTLLPHVELCTGADPQLSIIWMHGLGADGWDFVPLVRELEYADETPIRFIFPHAPSRPVTINNGYVMPAWYDIAMNEIQRLPDERGIRESQAQIEAFIARENARSIPSDKIVLAGFSQGGAIALQTGLRYKDKLAGVMALSTYLTLGDSLAKEGTDANKPTPIFMAHGTEDPVVPFALAKQSRDALTQHGYNVKFESYPMLHSLCAEEVGAINDWLKGLFKSPIVLLS